MKTQTIVFDIDGVLADFIGGAMDVARGLFPDNDIPAVSTQTHQDWNTYPGLNAQEVTKVWQFIAEHPHFWQHLPIIASFTETQGIKRLIEDGHRVYFATNRKTPRALEYTYRFLNTHINYIHAESDADLVPLSVVTTHRKGEFCKVIDADYYLDDKSENVDCAIWMTDCKTKSYVINRPYNQGAKAPHSGKARSVSTIEQFLAEVKS